MSIGGAAFGPGGMFMALESDQRGINQTPEARRIFLDEIAKSE
jgi:hypothetical protein